MGLKAKLYSTLWNNNILIKIGNGGKQLIKWSNKYGFKFVSMPQEKTNIPCNLNL